MGRGGSVAEWGKGTEREKGATFKETEIAITMHSVFYKSMEMCKGLNTQTITYL